MALGRVRADTVSVLVCEIGLPLKSSSYNIELVRSMYSGMRGKRFSGLAVTAVTHDLLLLKPHFLGNPSCVLPLDGYRAVIAPITPLLAFFPCHQVSIANPPDRHIPYVFFISFF